MRFISESSPTEDLLDINVTSFIDVLFTLLLFFMVTTTFDSAQGISIKLPGAKTGAAEKSLEPLDVTITKDGAVYLKNKAISDAELYETFLKAKEKDSQVSLIIRADKDARHGRVVQVMDEARKHGIERLSITTAPVD